MTTTTDKSDPTLHASGVSLIPPAEYAKRLANGAQNPLANGFKMGFYAAGCQNLLTANHWESGRGSAAFHKAWAAGWQAWHKAKGIA